MSEENKQKAHLAELKKEYWCDGCGDCGYYHARRCTKEEVERITGLKVEDQK